MKYVEGESVTCKECDRTWPAGKVWQGFYSRKNPIIHGGHSLHVLQPCKYCRCKINKAKYVPVKERNG